METRIDKLTVNQIMAKYLGEPVTDEEVIDVLVQLRRLKKNDNMVTKTKALYDELAANKMI
jgi:hypothetical protein